MLEELHIAACMQRGAEGEFDVVHSHLHVHALVFGRLIRCPLVTTLHGSAWVRATHPILHAYRELPFVSLSDAERRMLPELNYVATVYNGIRIEQFPFEAEKDDYLLFAGRLSPEKGPDRAIEVAKRSVQTPPHGRHDRGPVPGVLRRPGAAPPRRWADRLPGPAVAAGVGAVLPEGGGGPLPDQLVRAVRSRGRRGPGLRHPLIATRHGALPEIIVDGETGFVVDSLDEAASAVKDLDGISPAACRANAERRFSVETMARGYETVYVALASEGTAHSWGH